MHTQSSRRGAARVSAVWTIVAFMLFFIALGFGYVMSEEATNAKSALATAQADNAKNADAVNAEIAKWSSVSEILGYRGESTTVPSNVEAARGALANVKNVLPDADAVKSYQDLVPAAQTAYTAAQTEIATLRSRITDLESQVGAGRQQLTTVTSDKDQRISALQEQLADLQSNTSSEISTLESRVASLTASRNDLDASLKTEESAKDDLTRQLAEASASMQSYRRNVSKSRADITKAAQKADGEITEVSTALGKAWINLGAGDRLSEGIVFRVTGSDPSDIKGFIEVMDVGPSRAVCSIISLTDTFDPIVQGQDIWNDLYEKKGQRYAVLAGRFDGMWNEKELRILLEEIGITVQDQIDINTDFLLAGSATFEENEDGETVAVQVADTAEYKDAQNQGLTIVSIRDVEQYFRK